MIKLSLMFSETEAQINFETRDQFKKTVIYPLLSLEIDNLSFRGGLTVLFIGEGSGQISRYLTREKINRALLIDKNPEILDIASKNFKNCEISAIGSCLDVTREFPYLEQTVNVAIASFSLNQIENINKVFEQAHKCIIHNGKFIVIVPDEEYILFCSIYRQSRLSEKVTSAFDRQHLSFNFQGVKLNVDLYVRPNYDYYNAMVKSGFVDIRSGRIYDPIDDSIGDTPKAYFLSGTKL